MNINKFQLLFFIPIILFFNIYAIAEEGNNLEHLNKELAATADPTERAFLYKSIGDFHVSREDFKNAAESYIKAHSLYQGFPEHELITMALYASWADRLDYSVTFLRSILGNNPANTIARSDLARILMLQGHLQEAITEADNVLEITPDDIKTLLIKAKALEWDGRVNEAIQTYDKILEKNEDFDARLNLANLRLLNEDIEGARINSGLLDPQTPQQEQALAKLLNELKTRETAKETIPVTVDLEELNRELEASISNEKKARLLKKIGDYYITKDDYENAALSYLEALDMGPDYLPLDQRIKMAEYISWSDRLDDAVYILDMVIVEDNGNQDARIALARILSWTDRPDEALEEVETILHDHPNNQEALIIKANVLRWNEKQAEAIPFYVKALEEEENFGGRIGLTYALVSVGDRTKALETFAPLEPKYGRQLEEYEKLTGYMNSTIRRYVDISHTYHRDSDHNRYNRYSASYGFWVDNYDFTLEGGYIDAYDDQRNNSANFMKINGQNNPFYYLKLGAGIGFTELKDNGSQDFFTWSINGEIDISDSTIGVGILKEPAIYSAELIENGISSTIFSLSGTKPLNKKTVLFGTVEYRDISDGNSSFGFTIRPRYTLKTGNPNASLSYMFRYIDYDQQNSTGYFDPSKFYAHQVTLSVSCEKGRWYSFAEPYVGYQTFTRFEEDNSDLIAGASASLGYKITRRLSLEINGEGGNFAMETASGYNYYSLGLLLHIIL